MRGKTADDLHNSRHVTGHSVRIALCFARYETIQLCWEAENWSRELLRVKIQSDGFEMCQDASYLGICPFKHLPRTHIVPYTQKVKLTLEHAMKDQ